MEEHLNHLKKKHTRQLQNMQTLVDKQSGQIDSLLTEIQSAKALHKTALHRSDAAEQQVNSIKQKWMTANQEAESERLNSEQMQALHEASRAQLQKASEAATAAHDRECNLQQQVAMLKAKIQESTSETDKQSLQAELELAHQQKAALLAQLITAGELAALMVL